VTGVVTSASGRAGVWGLRNANSTGPAQVTVRLGRAGDRYLAGDAKQTPGTAVVGDWDNRP
jgi:hypothetical protein